MYLKYQWVGSQRALTKVLQTFRLGHQSASQATYIRRASLGTLDEVKIITVENGVIARAVLKNKLYVKTGFFFFFFYI